MTTTLRSLGHRVLQALLIEVREKAGLTQRELAELLGRPSKSYVDRIESGDQIPDPLECRDWAQKCGVSGWKFWWHFENRMKQNV